MLINASIDELPFPRVSCDDASAIEQAFGHLPSLGHTSIGLVLGPSDHVPRSANWPQPGRSAQRPASLPDDGSSSRGHTRSRAARPRRRALSEGVTGIVCASDPLALGAIRAARRAGLRVPTDISVVGYDDSAFMACTDPPLTTVRQPIEAMGRAAIDLLVSQIDGDARRQDELLFEPELVVRGSTGAGAGRAAAELIL